MMMMIHLPSISPGTAVAPHSPPPALVVFIFLYCLVNPCCPAFNRHLSCPVSLCSRTHT
jgi:hypothetical protein